MSDLENVVIELSTNDSKTEVNLKDDFSASNTNVNFGGGLELLMNEKKKGTSTNEIPLGELSDLENELNNLSSDINTKTVENNRSEIFSSILNSTSLEKEKEDDAPKSINLDSDNNLGKETANNINVNKTWDGYGKVNPVPVISEEAPMSKEELIREKFKYLRRLEELESKGANLTKKYTMDSPLQELQGEYEMIINEKEKSNSVKFQGKMLMACITGLEFLNNKFDPFDLKMDIFLITMKFLLNYMKNINPKLNWHLN